jgi:two-component system C4-dicarboxylate transport sensor histidine kinase DctB
MLENRQAQKNEQALKQEEISQLYRLAELGRLSSGIFHDLINPLTAVSLNLEQIKKEANGQNAPDEDISRAKSYLDQALLAAHKMEGLMTGVKKQIQKEGGIIAFDPNLEIREIIQILAYKARRANVRIEFMKTENLIFTGDAVKFSQIIINLLTNAIDASENRRQEQLVAIILERKNKEIIITIQDQGIGIIPENINKIFEPYFSTKKKNNQGLGIGLTLTKNIIEKIFQGTIKVTSQVGVGTSFIVFLPIRNTSEIPQKML